jgi:putative transposase
VWTERVVILFFALCSLFLSRYLCGVLLLRAYKFELQPGGRQSRDMRSFAGACRFVYNRAFALEQTNHEAGNKFIGYVAMAKYLTAWRRDPATSWLADAPVHPLQHALKDLEKAYKNFFAKRAAFPRFKKKGQHSSFRYPDAKQFKLDAANSRIFLPKLGWVRYRNSRDVLGTPKNVTVSMSNGKWFVSIQTAREVEQPIHSSASEVGVDMGIVRLATLSDGTVVPSLNSFKRKQAELRKAQRAMSRKKKFSSNWKKAKAKVQRIHVRIANARRDYLHKTSTTISKNHAMVVVEDLQVSNMSRSAAGSVEHPGRNVKQKSGLNRSILDQGWAEFRRQLDYKLAWAGVCLLQCRPKTPQGRAHAADTSPSIIGRHKRSSTASNADTLRTPIS